MRNPPRHPSEEDLLMAVDGELPARRRAEIEAHVEECEQCRSIRARLEGVAETVTALWRSETIAQNGLAEPRRRLRQWLSLRPENGTGLVGRHSSRVAASAMVAAATIALFVFVRGAGPDGGSGRESGALPRASLTPGATWNLTMAEVCSRGVRERRDLPEDVRRKVLRSYGMEHVDAGEYELDYLITPELGGAADAENVWPQRYGAPVWNAHVKDQLEHLLPRLVCEGRVPLDVAQRDIADDWIAAYRKYFRTDLPLPVQARLGPEAAAEAEDGEMTYPLWRSATAPALRVISFSASR